jgi:predicted aldo/keto reductase-like oxidoreductase
MMDAYNHRILQGPEPRHVTDRLKWHWGSSPEQAAECVACGLCEQRCTQHLPISDRMKEIAELAQTKG